MFKIKYFILVALGLVSTFADNSKLSKSFSERHLKFTTNLYKELIKINSGNFLVCPLSVEIILAMLNTGVQGKTSEQLIKGLQLPKTSESEIIEKTFKAIIPKQQENDYYNLSIANKIYVQDGFKISDYYKTTVNEIFQGDIDNINFKSRNTAVKTVNTWVEEKTRNLIKDVINEKDLDDGVNMILISTMHFQKLLYAFSKLNTKSGYFYLNNRDRVNIDMMQTTGPFQYYESKTLNAKFLQLFSFSGDSEEKFIIVLPNDKDDLANLETKIDQVLIDPPFTEKNVKVVMPKFKIETTIKFKSVLQSLGIVDVFEDDAEYTDIDGDQGPLKISNIFQKVIMDVNEDGINADYIPPLTSGSSNTQSHFTLFGKSEIFQADHPFLFYIKINGLNTFVGRFTLFPPTIVTETGKDPKKEEKEELITSIVDEYTCPCNLN